MLEHEIGHLLGHEHEASGVMAETLKPGTRFGIDGLWLAAALGAALMTAGLIAVPTIVHVMGASPGVAPYATEYLRISLLGAPFVLVALAAAGYLRGAQDTRTTLYVAVAANGLNLVLEVVLC